MLELNKIYNQDCIEGMKLLEDNSVDAIVTDPPYGLSFMGKKWDYDIPSIEVWKEALRVLKPGGYLLSFAGTRTQHRMAARIEDAGFEIRDMIAWVYGSGFPKSLNIGKAVDKLQGNERDKIGYQRRGNSVNTDFMSGGNDITSGTSEWEGWGTALKPALEPITVARKPLSEKTVAENCLKYGTGGINIDDCRVDFQSKEDYDESVNKNRHGDFNSNNGIRVPTKGIYSGDNRPPVNYEPQGRFPANLIHDGSEEVTNLFPDTKSQGHWSKTKTTGFGEFGNGKSEYFGVGEKDKLGGSASRFFYCAKASSSERNNGCDELEEQVLVRQGLAGEHKNPTHKNNHPTVKPLKLMQYLVRLVTRKGGVVLDPFMGSGTTAVACKFEEMNFIGFERENDYANIAKERVENYLSEYEIESYEDSKKVVLKQQRWF